MIYVDFNFLPVARETMQQFHAPDPWAEGRATLWKVVAYQFETRTMACEYPLNPGKKTNPMRDVYYGIESSDRKRYRILPLGLQDLWKEGRLPVGEVPRILHAIEGRLPLSAYPPPLQVQYFRLLCILFTVLTVILLGLYVWAEISGTLAESEVLLYGAFCFAAVGAIGIGAMRIAAARRQKVAAQALRLLGRVSLA